MDYASIALNLTPNTGTATVGDLSQATVYSTPIDIRYRKACAVFAQISGSPSGSLTLMGNVNPIAALSNVPPTDPSWSAVGSAVAVSGAGTKVIDLIDTGCLYLMLVYTRTSGTGTMTATAGMKG